MVADDHDGEHMTLYDLYNHYKPWPGHNHYIQ